MGSRAMPLPEKCPNCQTDLYVTDDSQPGNAVVTHAVLGIQVQGVYDGVLFWRCQHCGHPMHRFDKTSRLHWEAEQYMAPPEVKVDSQPAEEGS